MSWIVQVGDEFEPEFYDLDEEVRTEILAQALLVQQFGPQLGRPRVDTLKGSRYPNMKELRFSAAGGEWRLAFAFDPARKAVFLVAGDKSGGSESKFYKRLIARAERRYAAHLSRLQAKERR